MSTLTLSAIRKSFKGNEVLHGIDLTIESGAFVSLLGPSGCGKTTLLRCIAGLEAPSSGSIIIGGDDVTVLPPERRRLGMMFQSYALFPHMTVMENVRFGLRMRGDQPVAEQRRLAREALAVVRMGQYADRLPSQLSGGQQQRVALARAIAPEPRVLLLDEPLSNLDARLRDDMQIELVELHRRLGLTTVFVTHDQHEAMTMSDTVVLMRDGAVEQVGSPEEVYRRPRTPFAAEFIGAANMINAECVAGSLTIEGLPGLRLPCPDNASSGVGTLVVRTESITVAASASPGHDSSVPVRVVTSVFRGPDVVYVAEVAGQQLKIVAPATSTIVAPGGAVASWDSGDAYWLEEVSSGPAALDH